MTEPSEQSVVERRLNAYWCPDCHGYVITEDVDKGVTPMFLACRVKGEPNARGNTCKGHMKSMMYPKQPWPAEDDYGHQIPTEPTWEWYMPDRRERRRLSEGILAHVVKGGLLLRRKGKRK